MLDGLFEAAAEGDEFPFIEGTPEDGHVLIEGFDIFFRHRLTILGKSDHVLDVEEVVREKFQSFPLPSNITFRFSDSKLEPMIQLSDITAGLLGKFFNYLVLTDTAKIRNDVTALDERQKSNLAKLGAHLARSSGEQGVGTPRYESDGYGEVGPAVSLAWMRGLSATSMAFLVFLS